MNGWVKVKATDIVHNKQVISLEVPEGMVQMFKATHPELNNFEVIL